MGDKKLLAKQKLKKMFDENNHYGFTYQLISGKNVDFFKNKLLDVKDFSFTPNRESGVILDYPIGFKDNWNSWNVELWDETYLYLDDDEAGPLKEDWVPKKEECMKLGYDVIEIVDVVCVHKGLPYFGFIIKDDKQVSGIRAHKLRNYGIEDIYEISQDWILNQPDNSTKLKIDRKIC